MISERVEQIRTLVPPQFKKPYIGRQRPKPMTIAAGFKYRDGILLCADREITEGASKYSRPKVMGEKISPSVSLGFCFAGTVDYAVMAIQEITAVVKSSRLTKHAQIWTAIKDTVRDIYGDSMGGLLQSRQTEAGFSLLIGVWAEGHLKLYSSEDTALTEEHQYRCIGIGKDLARYILHNHGIERSDQMTVRIAEMVAMRILKHAKESVSGCGKETDVLILDSGGSVTTKSQEDYRSELKLIDLYDDMVAVLFPFAADLNLSVREREVGFYIATSRYWRELQQLLLDRAADQRDREKEG
jgi:20S proteasome alpha/beta subunit